MKDFTTPEHLKPILAEIEATFYPVTDAKTRAALHCDVLLQNRKNRDAIAVRAGGAFYYYKPAARALYAQIREYATAAETEPGELDQWTYNEESRAQHAIRDAIINLYGIKEN